MQKLLKLKKVESLIKYSRGNFYLYFEKSLAADTLIGLIQVLNVAVNSNQNHFKLFLVSIFENFNFLLQDLTSKKNLSRFLFAKLFELKS